MSANSSPQGVARRLRRLLRGDDDTPAQLEHAIAQMAQLHAHAAQAARAAREAHEDLVLHRLTRDDEPMLISSRSEAANAAAHEADLSLALRKLHERLASARATEAAREQQRAWSRAAALLDTRRDAVARLQACADAYGRALQDTVAATDAAWAALPALPAHRPATYGRDLYARAALYLYGVTDGKSGPQAGGLVSAHAARQRPDLVALDAGAREMLLMARSAAQTQAAAIAAGNERNEEGNDKDDNDDHNDGDTATGEPA